MRDIDLLRQKEIDYCYKNPVYWLKTYGHIEDKDAAELIQPFNPWKEQIETFQAFLTHKHNIVLKARQLGFTWLALHYAGWVMLTKPGRTVIGLSRTEDDAKELIRRLGVIFRYMSELIAEKGNVPAGYEGAWFETSALSLTIHFPGQPDSKMTCQASSQDAGRSLTADLLIIDEWAAQQFAREIWTAAYPTINRPTGGQIIGISTNKRGTLFEELYESKDNTFYHIFIPWYADPRRGQDWYDETLRNIGEVAMAQEYPATEEEAMSTPGGAFFPEVTKDSFVADEMKGTKVTYFVMDYGLDMLAAYWINVDTDRNAQIIREYCKSDLPISTAADTILNITQELVESKEIEHVQLYLAPPDLWSRSQETGKSRAIIFSENGLYLTKCSNDLAAGCAALKEYLKHDAGKKSKLTSYGNCAKEAYRCLTKIQHDEKKPNVYAKDPHDLTHCCLVGDTIIKTPKGDFRIEDLVGTEGYVYAYDGEKAIEKPYMNVCMTNPNADIYEIELEDGTIVQATSDHPFLTEDGWKALSELTTSDSIIQCEPGYSPCK